MISDRQLNEKFYELHKKLVDEVIKFLKDNNITDAFEFNLYADGIDYSIEDGEWTAATDSSFSVSDKKGEKILYSI